MPCIPLNKIQMKPLFNPHALPRSLILFYIEDSLATFTNIRRTEKLLSSQRKMPFPTGQFVRDAGHNHPSGCICPQCVLPAQSNTPALPTPPRHPDFLPATFSMASYEAGEPILNSESYMYSDGQRPQVAAREALPRRPRTPRPSAVSEFIPSFTRHSYIGRPAYNTACAPIKKMRTNTNVPGAFPVYATDNAPLKDTRKEDIKPGPYTPIQDMPSHSLEASKAAAAAAKTNYLKAKADVKDIQEESTASNSHTPLKDTLDRSFEKCIAIAAEAKADYQKAKTNAKAAADAKRVRVDMQQLKNVRPELAADSESLKEGADDEAAKKAQADEKKAEEAKKAEHKRSSQADAIRAAINAADEARADAETRRDARVRKADKTETANQLWQESTAEALQEEHIKKLGTAMWRFEATTKAQDAKKTADAAKKLENELQIEKANIAEQKRRAEEVKKLENVGEFEKAFGDYVNSAANEAKPVKTITKSVKLVHSQIQADSCETPGQVTKPTESVKPSQSLEQADPSKSPEEATTSTKSTISPPTSSNLPQAILSKIPVATRPTKTPVLLQSMTLAEQSLWKDYKAGVSERVERESSKIEQEAEEWEEVGSSDREEWEMVDRIK
jgi:hypothetical protein